jgi:hypothetical protein
MIAVAPYLSGLAVTLLLAVAVALVLHHPLRRLLVELCGNEARAGFWTVFSHVTLVLAPLLGALHRRPLSGADVVLEVSAQLEWALGGLLAGMLAVGLVLARFIAAHERREALRPAARPAATS